MHRAAFIPFTSASAVPLPEIAMTQRLYAHGWWHNRPGTLCAWIRSWMTLGCCSRTMKRSSTSLLIISVLSLTAFRDVSKSCTRYMIHCLRQPAIQMRRASHNTVRILWVPPFDIHQNFQIPEERVRCQEGTGFSPGTSVIFLRANNVMISLASRSCVSCFLHPNANTVGSLRVCTETAS